MFHWNISLSAYLLFMKSESTFILNVTYKEGGIIGDFFCFFLFCKRSSKQIKFLVFLIYIFCRFTELRDIDYKSDLIGKKEQQCCSNCIIYYIQLYYKILQDIFQFSGVLMEYFHEGIAPIRHWYVNPNEKSKKYKSSLLKIKLLKP